MENLVVSAKMLGDLIETFIDEASDVRSQVLNWVVNNERISAEPQAAIHQLRILLQKVNAADSKIRQEYGKVADVPIFSTTGLKQTCEQLNYGPVADKNWKIAAETISQRGLPHYLNEVTRRISMIDEKLREADMAIQIWNGEKCGDRTTRSDVELALEGVNSLARALQSFVQTGILVITAATEAQKSDA